MKQTLAPSSGSLLMLVTITSGDCKLLFTLVTAHPTFELRVACPHTVKFESAAIHHFDCTDPITDIS